MNLQELLNEARARIEVTPEELAEAKRRRSLVADTLSQEFGGRVYFNGSVEHGDANDPLTDFDIGVVVPDTGGEYGPGAKSATELKERARTAIRDTLEKEFPDLRVDVEGHKRSVVVRFSSPVSDRVGDLTGDVILALDHPLRGLQIPRYDSWDRSDPEKHTELILKANAVTSNTTAHANRLLKYWSARHDRPLCSWHIKVFTRAAVTEYMPLLEALERFFSHAHDELGKGNTPDPTGVGPEIAPRVSRSHALSRLSAALDRVCAARDAEESSRPLRAQEGLALLLPGIVDRPDEQALADEDREYEIARLRAAGNLVGVGVGAHVSLANTRGWSYG